MFHVVREWWSGGRGKVTARLFLFEFLVVVAGVLVAQGLANWVAERGERAEAERLLANLTGQITQFRRDLNFWGMYGPCLRDHVAAINRTAAAGGAMSAEQIGRPALPLPGDLALSADDWRKIRSIVPEERAGVLSTLSGSIDNYRVFSADIARQWAVLRLLDESAGQPSVADRSQVRLAATIIDNNIRWMMFQRSAAQINNFRAVGLSNFDALPDSARLVDRCGLFKDWR